MESNRKLVILSYLSIYTIWSSTFLFISLAVQTISPAWLVGIRFLFSGLVFFLFPILAGQIKSFPTWKEILSSVFLGFFLLVMGNGLVTVAEHEVPSYMAALIIATVPILASLWKLILFREKLSWIKWLGMVIGLGGVVLIVLPGGTGSLEISPLLFLVFLAVLGWSFGTSMGSHLPSHKNPFFNVGMQMLFASVFAVVYGLITEGNPIPNLAGASALSLWSLAFLTIFGGLAIAGFNYLIKVEPISRVTSYAMVNPPLATLLGIFVIGETATAYLWWGIPLILLGLYLTIFVKKAAPSKTPGQIPAEETFP